MVSSFGLLHPLKVRPFTAFVIYCLLKAWNGLDSRNYETLKKKCCWPHVTQSDMWPHVAKKMPLEPLQAQRHPYLSQFATADWCSKIAVQKYRRGSRGERWRERAGGREVGTEGEGRAGREGTSKFFEFLFFLLSSFFFSSYSQPILQRTHSVGNKFYREHIL